MGLIATIALVVLGISFMTFVAFFGRLPALRHTPIALLHRAIWIYFPNAVLALDQKVTSGRLTSSVGKFCHYLMNDRHPTVMVFFFLLLSVSEIMYLPTAWPLLSYLHKALGAISIALPYIFLYLAAATDPGAITPANHAYHMTLYPYDFTLFHPGAECRTCHLLKPPRSKHCPICKRCIGRLDHHCIFINNCVGVGNQHWFLLLLLTTGILTLYGGVLGTGLLTNKMRSRYPNWSLWPPRAHLSDGRTPMTLKQYLIVWTFGLHSSVAMGSVTLLALLTSPLVWGLLAYHMYLIYCGTTTNESLKWAEWKEDMDEGFAFRRRLPTNRVRDVRVEPAWTRWPVDAEQIVVSTENGMPPPPHPDLLGVGEWERVWKLRDVENLYDLGFWDNLVDVFLPGRLFEDSKDMPVMEDRGRERGRMRGRKQRRRARES